MNQPLVATLELPLYFLFFKLLYQPATKKAIMSRVISIACLRSDHEDFRRWCRHENVHCVPLLFLTLCFFFFLPAFVPISASPSPHSASRIVMGLNVSLSKAARRGSSD